MCFCLHLPNGSTPESADGPFNSRVFFSQIVQLSKLKFYGGAIYLFYDTRDLI